MTGGLCGFLSGAHVAHASEDGVGSVPMADGQSTPQAFLQGQIAGHRRSETRQCRIDRFGILRFRLDENIKIFGSAGLRMDGNSIAAHDQIFNAVFVERGQEFFEVAAEHCASGPSVDSP